MIKNRVKTKKTETIHNYTSHLMRVKIASYSCPEKRAPFPELDSMFVSGASPLVIGYRYRLFSKLVAN